MKGLELGQLDALTQLHVSEVGNEQLFLVAACQQTTLAWETAADVYARMADVLAGTGMQIAHEQIFHQGI